MSTPKIDLSEIFNELDQSRKHVAWEPTEEQIKILKHARPAVSYQQIAKTINKFYGLDITANSVKYYCDKSGIY